MASGVFKIGKIRAAIDESGLVNEYTHKAEQALAKITLIIARDTDPFVPWDTGQTAKSAFTASDWAKGLINYDTPYADRIYNGDNYNFSHDTHPQAQAHWFDASKERNEAEWTEKVAKLMGGQIK